MSNVRQQSIAVVAMLKSVPMPIDSKQEFEVLYSTLCEIQKSLLDSTTKVAGFFLLAAGWLATSDSARLFIRSDSLIRNTSIMAVLGVTVLSTYVSWTAYSASGRIAKQIDELQYVSAQSVAHRRVSLPALTSYIAANIFLAVLVVVALLRVGNVA
jgi:hypothetical protein